MTNVGSSPPSASTDAIRLVVVVLPCVPATAMPCFRRISSASISARGTTGMPRSRAASTSGLSVADRRRHDDGVGTLRRSRARVPDRDVDAERTQPARRRALGEVGARHLVALRRQHFGDAAHAGAADADEVDALDLVLHAGPRAACRPRASSMHASATRSAASRRPTRCAAHGHRRARPRASVRRARRRAALARVSSSCGITMRGAGVDAGTARSPSARRRSRPAAARRSRPGRRPRARRPSARRRGRRRGRPTRSAPPCRR